MAIRKLGSKAIFRDPNVKTARRYKSDVRIPGVVRPYRFKTSRKGRLDPDYVTPTAATDESLTGFVRGQKASDLEERLAFAINQAGLDFVFQYEVHSAFSLPGEEKTIDFIVYDGGTPFPVETGSLFVHGHPSRIEADRTRDQILNEILRFRGFQEIIRLPFDHPEDFDDAREIVRELFG